MWSPHHLLSSRGDLSVLLRVAKNAAYALIPCVACQLPPPPAALEINPADDHRGRRVAGLHAEPSPESLLPVSS